MPDDVDIKVRLLNFSPPIVTIQNSFIPGPQGVIGQPGIGVQGEEGDEGDFSLIPGPQGQLGLNGTGIPFLWKKKIIAESVVSSAVLQDDDILFVSLGAGEVWKFEFFIVYESGTTSDFKVAVAAPVGASGIWGLFPQYSVGNAFQVTDALTFSLAISLGGSGAGMKQIAIIQGIVGTVGAGVLKLQWAQNTSNATTAIVHPFSYLLAERLEP